MYNKYKNFMLDLYIDFCNTVLLFVKRMYLGCIINGAARRILVV